MFLNYLCSTLKNSMGFALKRIPFVIDHYGFSRAAKTIPLEKFSSTAFYYNYTNHINISIVPPNHRLPNSYLLTKRLVVKEKITNSTKNYFSESAEIKNKIVAFLNFNSSFPRYKYIPRNPANVRSNYSANEKVSNPSGSQKRNREQLVYLNSYKWYVLAGYPIIVVISLIISCNTVFTFVSSYYYSDSITMAENMAENMMANKFETSQLNPDFPLLYILLTNAFLLALLYFANLLRARSLLRIVYDPNSKLFEAVKYDGLMRKRCFQFSRKEARETNAAVNKKFVMGDLNGNFFIKDRLYFLLLKDFASPLHYNMLVGNKIKKS